MSRLSSNALAAGLLALGIATAVQAGTNPAQATPQAASSPSAKETSKQAHSTAKVDLNHATREELMKLPGMTEATADKIIAARPFKSKNELVSKGILPEKEYQGISGHVMVKSESKSESHSSSKEHK